MVCEEQECEMELESEKVPVPSMENTIEESAKVQEPRPEVLSKKHGKKELNAKILTQMEFYFGDANLRKDRYLAKVIDQDPWVDLNFFIAEKKQILTRDPSRIAKALKKSTMLEVSEDRTKVRCITPIQVKEVIAERVETGNEESDSKKYVNSQVPQKKKKRKSRKKGHDSGTESDQHDSVSNPSKEMKEHREGIKRRGGNSESLDASDGNDELVNDSSVFESDTKRKKIKHEPSETEPKKQSSQQIGVPSEAETKIKKKRKLDYKAVEVLVKMEEKKVNKSESMEQAQQPTDEVNVQKEKKRKRKRNRSIREEDLDTQDTGLEIMTKRELKLSTNKYFEMESPCIDPKNLKALRAESCEDNDEEIAKQHILNEDMIEEKMETANCEESDSKKDSKSQVPRKKKKKKKKRVSIDETVTTNEGVEDSKKSKKRKHSSCAESDRPDSVSNASKREKEHIRARERKGRNSESLNAADESDELTVHDSCVFDCDKKRKRMKHELSVLEPTKQSLPKMKILPEQSNIPKKQNISDSKIVAANNEGQSCEDGSMKETEVKKSNSESTEQAQQPSDEVNVQKEKKRKHKKNRPAREEDIDTPDIRLEILSKRESKLLR